MPTNFDVTTLCANVLRELETLGASDACKQGVRSIVSTHVSEVARLREKVAAADLVGVQEIKFWFHLTDNDDRDEQVGRAVQWAVKRGLQTRGEIETRKGCDYLTLDCRYEFEDEDL